jgi:hypothetical protein
VYAGGKGKRRGEGVVLSDAAERMPRFSQEQDGYYATLHDGFSVVAVPTTIQGDRLDTLCAVLEAMASASYNIVKPVYYETTLRTKLVNDPQSSEMMDMIMNSVYLDLGYVQSWTTDITKRMAGDIMNNKLNVVSTVEKQQKKISNTIEKAISDMTSTIE